MSRGGTDAGVVHARQSWREEAGVGQVPVQGGGVHRVQARVLVVLAQHVQPLPLIQVRASLVLPPRVHGQRVVVVVVVVVVVRFPIPE